MTFGILTDCHVRFSNLPRNDVVLLNVIAMNAAERSEEAIFLAVCFVVKQIATSGFSNLPRNDDVLFTLTSLR